MAPTPGAPGTAAGADVAGAVEGSPPLHWTPPPEGVDPRAWRFGMAVLRATVPTLYRARVAGREHLPREGGVLLVANHVHDIDPPFAAWAVSPRRLLYFASAHNFESRWLGPLIGALGAFPVWRDRSDVRGLRYARTQLELGRIVLMFPEGRPAYGAPMAPFLQGAGHLALVPGISVVPMAIAGTDRVVDRHRIPRRRGPVGMAFGPAVPVPASGPRRRRSARVLEDVRTEITRLQGWLHAQLEGGAS